VKGHIEQGRNGSWIIVIDKGRNPVTQKRQRISKTVRVHKREAEKIMYAMLSALEIK
jgi:integrase